MASAELKGNSCEAIKPSTTTTPVVNITIARYAGAPVQMHDGDADLSHQRNQQDAHPFEAFRIVCAEEEPLVARVANFKAVSSITRVIAGLLFGSASKFATASSI